MSIKWKKYPDTAPTKSGLYLVCHEVGKDKYTLCHDFQEKDKISSKTKAICWMELPPIPKEFFENVY